MGGIQVNPHVNLTPEKNFYGILFKTTKIRKIQSNHF